MNKNTEELFEHLCLESKKLWEESKLGTKEIEPSLLNILNFVKNNINYKLIFSNKFKKILIDPNEGPLEIVIFCMRELQWLEIKNAALERSAKISDMRTKSAMRDVIAVYEDKWEDADLYEYYTKKS